MPILNVGWLKTGLHADPVWNRTVQYVSASRSPPSRFGSSPIALRWQSDDFFWRRVPVAVWVVPIRDRHYQVLRGRMMGRPACRVGQDPPNRGAAAGSIRCGISARRGASASMKLPPERHLRGGSFLHKTEQTVVHDGFQSPGFFALPTRACVSW